MTEAGVARELQTSPLPTWLSGRSVGWAGVVLALLVVALTTGFLLHEKQALEANERQSAELYARVLQDQGERTFNTIDIALAALADTLGSTVHHQETGSRDADLLQASRGLPFIRSLSLMTAEGRVLASSSSANVGVLVDTRAIPLPANRLDDRLGASVGGRDLVDVQRGRVAPASMSRTFIPLARGIGGADAARLYVVAVLNPDFFGNEYELVLADPTRRAAVFSIDGVMLAGTSNVSTSPGQHARQHRFFSSFLPNRESGTYVGDGIDGTAVVTAFRVLRKRPLVVIVERSRDSILATFHRTLWLTLGVCAGALLGLLAVLVMAWRSLKAHETVSSALEATRAGIAASEHDLRVLVESVHELIFRADAAGRIVFVNGRWRELTQRPASEVLGMRATDLCRDDERQACLALFARPETRDETILVHVMNAAGSSVALDLSVSRVVDAQGRTSGYAGFAVDISERESARLALQAQLSFTAHLIELSPTPVFVKDGQGRFVTVNKAWLELMNLSLAEVLGRDSTDLFGASALKHQEHDARLLQSQARVTYENRLHVPGRPPRDTVVTKVRFTGADGATAGIVGSIVDVTEFREAERDIRCARDAAQLANSAKSEFIANISHELRTPLQGIIGFSELGRDMAHASPDFLDLFTDIHAGGQRMLTLVNGLLDVAQMDSAVGSLPLQRDDVAQLIRDAVGQSRSRAVLRDLTLNLRGLAQPLEADVDRMRFQQAVRNVLANAIRYSPRGAAIELSLSRAADSGVVFSVRDHGPGIPGDELETIFDAFVQSSRTRDGSGGTGLGLTIARKIMSAHGGSIVAANAEGGGALISLSLPAPGTLSDSARDLSWQDTDVLLYAPEVS